MKEKAQMRKRNMKIFPIYKNLGWDYMFFYTIDFLFLTQIKGINPADVVLKGAFYSLFMIILQIPANIVVEFLGRKNSIVLANILNCFYIIAIMLSKNLGDLIFAEFISAMAFAIKEVAEPSLLNESIPPSKSKSEIYAKINAKGASGYYVLNAISKIIAGILFTINGYLPLIFSLAVLIIAIIISTQLVEPIKRKNKGIKQLLNQKQIKDMEEGFAYIVKSERLKALIVCSSVIVTLIIILNNYEVGILEDLNITSAIIGVVSAFGSLVSAIASRRQEKFHNILRNKSLITIAMILSVSCLISGICGIWAEKSITLICIVILMSLFFNFGQGMYYTIIDKYLSNFSNKKIDTKIFATKNLFSNICRAIGGLIASFLLSKMPTAYCMIIVGVIFTIIYVLLAKYMKTRVGLKPEQYSEEERKYDMLKEEEQMP